MKSFYIYELSISALIKSWYNGAMEDVFWLWEDFDEEGGAKLAEVRWDAEEVGGGRMNTQSQCLLQMDSHEIRMIDD